MEGLAYRAGYLVKIRAENIPELFRFASSKDQAVF